MVTTKTNLPSSRHFTLERLGGGLYAAIAVEGAGAMSNAGIVDLGSATLVFDTFMTPQASADLRAAAEQLTGHPVRYVVNSHRHDDHVLGNVSFAGAEIVATAITREHMADLVAASIARYKVEAPAFVRAQEEELAAATDDRTRRELSSAVAFGHEMISALPALELALPTLTFADRLALHAASRRVEVLTYGGGHTESDLFAFLPDDGVLFAGDLVVLQNHPWLGHGDVVAWTQIVRRIEQLEFSILVPGHGPVGNKTDAAFVPRYIADLLRLTNDRIRDGATGDDVAATPVPDQYADLDAPEVFARNMRFLHAFVAARRAQEQA